MSSLTEQYTCEVVVKSESEREMCVCVPGRITCESYMNMCS